MPETFRKSKIEKYYASLRLRKSVIRQQINGGGTITDTGVQMSLETIAKLQGEIAALEVVLAELEQLFDLYNPNDTQSSPTKLSKD